MLTTTKIQLAKPTRNHWNLTHVLLSSSSTELHVEAANFLTASLNTNGSSLTAREHWVAELPFFPLKQESTFSISPAQTQNMHTHRLFSIFHNSVSVSEHFLSPLSKFRKRLWLGEGTFFTEHQYQWQICNTELIVIHNWKQKYLTSVNALEKIHQTQSESLLVSFL